MEKKFSWSGYNWVTTECGREFTSTRYWNWNDPDCVNVMPDGTLALKIQKHPKVFKEDGETYYPLWGLGLVMCEREFGYGTFEIIAKQPKGIGLWNAFWMYDKGNAVKPEVDIFEGYSGERGDYRDGCLRPVRVESCLHLEEGLGLPKTPARKPWFWQFNDDPSKGFHVYKFRWLPDLLEISIDGKVVRRFRDRDVTEYCEDRGMVLILNTHIDPDYLDSFTYSPLYPFVIEHFRYDQLK